MKSREFSTINYNHSAIARMLVDYALEWIATMKSSTKFSHGTLYSRFRNCITTMQNKYKKQHMYLLGNTKRRTCAILATVLILGAIAFLAHTLTEMHLKKHMLAAADQQHSKIIELKQQIKLAFIALSKIRHDEQSCSVPIKKMLAAITNKYRFIYSSAIELESGKVCNSYGQTLSSPKIARSAQLHHYRSDSGVDYWFKANRGVSDDEGEVILAYKGSYIWLNKGLVKTAMHTTEGISFDLVDKKTLLPVFSTDSSPWTGPNIKIDTNNLQYSGNEILLARDAIPNGLIAIASTSISQYFWRLIIFSLMIFICSAAALKIGISIYTRYFSFQARFRNAMKSGSLKINYQPIVDMNTNKWIGAEALLRCTIDNQSIAPDIIISTAHKSGLMSELTRRICTQVAEEHYSLLWACKDFYITINLSATDVVDETFPTFTKALFEHYQIPSSRIIFEITEESFKDKDKAIVQLRRLREQGHLIAIDDFGTGYSSLSYLETLPVDILKIDKSFLTPGKLNHHEGLWWHIISLGRIHNLIVVAEGVETEDQAEILRYAGVSTAQGWLYSKALPAVDLARHFFVNEYTRQS